MNQANFNNKTVAREYAFKFIYKLFLKDFNLEKDEILNDEFNLDQAILEFEDSYIKEDDEHLDNNLNPSIQKFGKDLVKGYLSKEAQVVDLISTFLQKRSFSSIGNIEKAVLCLGVYELQFTETPGKVVINEYINLVKKFGPKESFAFINGILDKVNKELN
ncbi:transcription antitermination factor NusB [Bacteriovorax sp. DB6_IX]|uniref:transcription antitermination factor NusB n=1 Tax=Bacteriovorax sp. DB6_IX TaxID=1353530 RepID=UPI00038A2548|nr:transcription antitermination factor NusB [Bacteriovorax sp. DB6_IX]EQC52635.1 transcription antitermination factor NusB [Bacteriovorax sp. DB6_IX]